MKVSVIIPCFQAQDFYRTAVNAALEQTHPDLEVILVSDDQTDYHHPDPRVVSVSTGRVGSGPNHARNVGLDYARGEIIAPLDADDWMHRTRLAKLLPLVKQYGVAGCQERTVDAESGQIQRQVFPPLPFLQLLSPRQYLALNATIHLVFRRDVTGAWPEDVALAGDTVFNLDAIERAGRLAIYPEPLFEYRTHAASHCHTPDAVEKADKGYAAILQHLKAGRLARDPELNAYALALFQKKREVNAEYGEFRATQGPVSFDEFLTRTQRA